MVTEIEIYIPNSVARSIMKFNGRVIKNMTCFDIKKLPQKLGLIWL